MSRNARRFLDSSPGVFVVVSVATRSFALQNNIHRQLQTRAGWRGLEKKCVLFQFSSHELLLVVENKSNGIVVYQEKQVESLQQGKVEKHDGGVKFCFVIVSISIVSGNR